MKKLLLIMMMVLGMFTSSIYAEDGNVTYSGDAGEFVFAPGSEYSLTDLFPNFKGVMPGDVLTQKIVVRNDASKKVKVKIYMRSLGAWAESKDFLSQLQMTVAKSADNTMDYMFDASADVTDGLSDWVLLGTLYSGGEVNLDVTLAVPVELDSTYMNQVGYLDWEFMVEELPVEGGDPKPPTSDDSGVGIYVGMTIVSFMFLLILIKRRKEEEE